MIKQIQLRGISRDPSDRSNSDGGCVESLNVQLNEGELAPAPIPKDITSTLGVDSTFKVLYIHKVGNNTNYIGRVGSSLCAKIDGEDEFVTIAAISADPDGITSIGNILVWTTSSGTNYALFRDDEYTYLGTSVPEPTVTFRTYASPQSAKDVYEMATVFINTSTGITIDNPVNVWNAIYRMKDDISADGHDAAATIYDNVMQNLWSQVNAARTTMRGNGVFEAPVMARYALKMFSGDYLYVSAPVILTGAEDHDHARMLANFGVTGSFRMMFWKVYFPTCYTADVRVDFGSAGLWKDLVESVDIFISTDIYVPPMNSKVRDAFSNGTKIVNPSAEDYDAGFEMDGVSDYGWIGGSITNRYKEDFETEMLNKGNFYKIASIPAFTQAYWEETLKPKSQDDLVVLPRLSEGDAHQVSGLGGVGSYNERLILTGEKITLSKGNQRPDALIPMTSSNSCLVSAYFYIRTEDGSTKIVEGYKNLDILEDERARAYITYPDPRCYMAEYFVPLGYAYIKVTLPMKEHPRINAAYGFWGLGLRLDELVTGDTRSSTTAQSISVTEDKTYTVDNRLFLSEMDDPFVFPLGQRITFSSKILASMPITIPLSTGQFGQYQLYVFTKDGIWAETITDEGKIAANHPVTRDAPFEGAIGQLDQGIVFASGSGVMLMYGSQVTNISPAMTSERYPIGIGDATLSNLGDWTSLMTIAMDTTSFLEYIKQARFAYDYPGKRIIVFRSDKTYAWVYKLDTSTWHKQQLPPGKSFSNTLNSYPDALVTMMSSGSASVMDFTTEYGQQTNSERTALVITRDLDFDAPDIRKSLKEVKIRGSFLDGGSAKFILLGSMDGKYFKQLTSLRDGSWKVYKVALLLKLFRNDRVSWIDVNFEPRFTNKLR